jgi:hypothetical protein
MEAFKSGAAAGIGNPPSLQSGLDQGLGDADFAAIRKVVAGMSEG